jgi:hypothetical protein
MSSLAQFTDAGEVAIKAEAHNGSFHVSVRDTGPGISSADQARLFQEFQQADSAITKKKGGTGLGSCRHCRVDVRECRKWTRSPLLALSGHQKQMDRCLLLGVKRTLAGRALNVCFLPMLSKKSRVELPIAKSRQ